MRLYEEYLKRHGIDDVPLAHHANSSCIVFKTKSPSAWSELINPETVASSRFSLPSAGIFFIRWVHSDHHPGHYEASLHYQLHDAYVNDQILGHYSISNFKWHEYESFMTAYAKKFVGIHLVKDRDHAVLAGWEMFVSAYDGWFSKQGGDIKYLLFQTLDDEISVSSRIEYISEILKKLSTCYPGVFRNWKYEVLNKVQYHADWFIDLVEKNGKELLSCKD